MKIAQIAPAAERAPRGLRRGAERVVSYLSAELARLGHQVTLFASGDARARNRAREFDVLHFHLDGALPPGPSTTAARKSVATVHGRTDLARLAPLLGSFDGLPLVAVAESQRRLLPDAGWIGTVYHCLPAEVCPLNPAAPRGSARYLAFHGRRAPDNALERANSVARASGLRLRVAREIDEADKPAFLGNALALVFPLDGPAPVGLPMLEAMSCGTPVIAWRRGVAPEIVDQGVTGFLVDSIEEAAAAVPRAASLDRSRVRQRFEQRFSAARMARDYLALYRTLGRRPA
jgi:glycosyltransferase involved in cell wall biosynthesis